MIQKKEIIASVHDEIALERVLKNNEVDTVFLMSGDLLSSKDQVQKLQGKGKKVFLHIDFMQGLQTDSKGVKYVAEILKPNGIISTKGYIVQEAKKHELLTIQRIFLIDTAAFHNGIAHIRSSKPHAVEVMPGLMPKMIKRLTENLSQPVIAGGLIRTFEEISAAFAGGASAVSLSCPEYWSKNEEEGK
ncbi:glycerol-3-phosphate responsive antiterminator [Bacillus aquiflavi]|uniref:Glycerol uptake operon antiterminator regulatory protein n=1 Tax=Bacillus aquiflavi TaxID=2672567 RepID=A0A6B3W2H6_9BACI|nr:glycerol-3-phosphate responsive antiterminator [Bacillus aquiflavi]MBA4537835.1 glycerol-3-phosphate responsive antiterminator [Bacillus aquiflavi]NEY82091.1 glycerol-3-phosphate responsive antiterminator [Bacillus aquiflavi]UAC48346.1 glycerol-3-phosphate responsive antiterminator [Bacillus aquiflavi]